MDDYTRSYRNGLKPDPRITFVEWANTKMKLTKESSVEPGQYRTSRTPWVEEILLELSPQSATQEVVVIKPTQFGFTTLANIILFGTADLYPGPCMMALPTDDMAKKHSKKKVTSSLKAIDCLKDKIKESKSRDSGNTILLKEFPGGSWTFTGSNSPASARSDSIKILILDDLDGFVQDMGKEGNYKLFENRTDAFGERRKIYKNSTPIDKESSHITKEFEQSSQGYFQVPCPYCGAYQYLEFGGKDVDHGIKFKHNDSNEVTEIWYICKYCYGRIEEYHKNKILSYGKYIHKFPERKKRGFKINSLYSPLGWLSWERIANEFLEAGKNKQKIQRWVNTRMAEPFEDAGKQPEWNKLFARCEPYKPFTVPEYCKILTLGCDVHDNNLTIVLRAWGKGEESALVYAGVLYGNVLKPEVWDQLKQIATRTYEHASGAKLRIVSGGIDSSDGSHKQSVYNFCRMNAPVFFPLKGSSTRGKQIINKPSNQDVEWNGQTIKNGIQLWPIGTDTAKSTIYSRLNIEGTGQGVYHWYEGLSEEYFLQLTAEKLITKFIKGYPVTEWHNVRTTGGNHFLDAEVYAYAAALRAGIELIDFDKIKLISQKDMIIKKDIENKNIKKSRREAPKRRMGMW